MAKTVFMVPDPQGGWLIKRLGADSDAGNFTSRGEALNFGRELCRELNADFEVHDLDGTVTRERLRRDKASRH